MDHAARVAGRATPAGTRRFAERFPELPGHFRAPDRLWLSSIGLGSKGGAVGGADDLAYRSIVPHAAELGVNVFDTSIAYRSMTSERAIGKALARAVREGVVARDEVYVITKGGYLTVDPDSPLAAQSGRHYLIETYIESGIVDPRDVVNGRHVLSGPFLRDQIERSRDNLGLETIDLYCIDEPEIQLAALGPTEFEKLLFDVFETLEAAVTRGAIASYGLSTWNGPLISHLDRDHLSLIEVFERALEVGGGDHHLRGILVPYSVAYGEARALDSQFSADLLQASVFETLLDTGTNVFGAVPLVQGRATRGLPSFLLDAFPGVEGGAQACLQFARSTPGVTSTLVGMRSAHHLEENLALARRPPADPDVIRALFERVKAGA